MKTKLIMTVALLATFANAQFFTNAPNCMNMYGIYSGEWGTSSDNGEK